jgi:hypothetical protein
MKPSVESLRALRFDFHEIPIKQTTPYASKAMAHQRKPSRHEFSEKSDIGCDLLGCGDEYVSACLLENAVSWKNKRRRPPIGGLPWTHLPISLNGEILLRQYTRRNGTRSLAHDVV